MFSGFMSRFALCLSICLLPIYIFANESKFLDEIRDLSLVKKATVDSVVDNNGMLEMEFALNGLFTGETGIVVRKLENYSVIVGSAKVVRVSGSRAVAEFMDFEGIQQAYLPRPDVKPQNGDILVFRSLNNKAFLIAPNSSEYGTIKSKYSFIDFLNSDLLMGVLIDGGYYDPGREQLQKACRSYQAGLVFVVGSREVVVLDCESGFVLKRNPLSQDLLIKNLELKDRIDRVENGGPDDVGIDVQSPFFTRIPFVEGGSIKALFSSKKSKSYFNYYDKVVENGLVD